MEKQFQLKGLGATDHNRIEHFIIKEYEKLLYLWIRIGNTEI